MSTRGRSVGLRVFLILFVVLLYHGSNEQSVLNPVELCSLFCSVCAWGLELLPQWKESSDLSRSVT